VFDVTVQAAARDVVKRVAVLADRVRRPPRGIVLLLYHRVGGASGMSVDLPTDLFDRQIEWLASQQRAVSLDTALNLLDVSEASARDPVVVTFDDGTADLVDIALPVLDRHRVPAVFYLATDFIEHARPFPHGGRPMSWAAVRDALSTGLVTLGSHTDTHALLDRIDPARATAELDRSRQLIEDRTGATAFDFAYPKGVPGSRDVDAIVRERFRSAALGGGGANPYGATDRHRLSRAPIQRDDGLRYFEHKACGGMALEGWLRYRINRARYARAAA
jgi:peptidoglycan/xylan/chitin deacetylase (PgdA/CDA1 family)